MSVVGLPDEGSASGRCLAFQTFSAQGARKFDAVSENGRIVSTLDGDYDLATDEAYLPNENTLSSSQVTRTRLSVGFAKKDPKSGKTFCALELDKSRRPPGNLPERATFLHPAEVKFFETTELVRKGAKDEFYVLGKLAVAVIFLAPHHPKERDLIASHLK
jgi:hypothetical protein